MSWVWQETGVYVVAMGLGYLDIIATLIRFSKPSCWILASWWFSLITVLSMSIYRSLKVLEVSPAFYAVGYILVLKDNTAVNGTYDAVLISICSLEEDYMICWATLFIYDLNVEFGILQSLSTSTGYFCMLGGFYKSDPLKTYMCGTTHLFFLLCHQFSVFSCCAASITN